MILMKNTKKIALTGIGTALFVVLSLCLQVPVFQNYYLCLGYIAMVVFLYNVGTASGTIVGVLGTILYCLLISGLRGMPGWAIGNIAIGLYLGLYFKMRQIMIAEKATNAAVIAVMDIAMIAVSTAIGILVLKSVTEVILYGQPFLVRVSTNSTAFIADCVVLWAGIPVAAAVRKALVKMGYIHRTEKKAA